MGRAPQFIEDPATKSLLMVQLAAGMYIIIRGFDNFAKAAPFEGGFRAFGEAWNLITAGSEKQQASLRAGGGENYADDATNRTGDKAEPMLEQWKAVRSRLKGLESPQHAHSLLLAVLWPLVVLLIALLALRHVTSAKDVADLISATASLLWPIIAITVVTWFRPELRALLARIRKGKFLGQEIELDELQAKTEEAEEAEETEAITVKISGAASATGAGSVSPKSERLEAAGKAGFVALESEIDEVLREAGGSPRIGLMRLSAKMERAARELASDVGLGSTHTNLSLSKIIRQLVEAGQLTREDAAALGVFNRVRNQIVHGYDAEDAEIARAIDSGTRLLRILLARQRQPNGMTEAD
jgi:hypothetical protein